MSKQYVPQTPFNTPFKILSSTMSKVNGVNVNTYVENTHVYFCSAKAWVGANKNINDLSAEEDSLIVDAYFIPTLKKNDRIKLLDDNSIWDVVHDPENINRRGQYMKLQVVCVHG